MMQHTGQVAAIIRKGWHQLEKDNCACVKYRCERVLTRGEQLELHDGC